MRITQNMIQRSALSTMQGNLRQIAVAQQRVSTGLRIQKASDDPVAAVASMQASGSLRALDQYRRNVQAAELRADAEESVLEQVSQALTRARELALGQAGSTATTATRSATKAEVDRLLESVVQLGNTRIAGAYLFGGSHATEPPVAWPAETRATDPPTLNPDLLASAPQQTEIAAGQLFSVSHNAHEVLGAGHVLQALWQLSQALGADDPAAIQGSLGALEDGFSHLQNLIGDVGARTNQLRVTAANLDALEVNLRTFRAELEEVDLEKAITELVSRQTAFQAAMLATSRVMGMTLTDYLR